VNVCHMCQVGTARVIGGVYSHSEGSTIVTLSHLGFHKGEEQRVYTPIPEIAICEKGERKVKALLTIASQGFIEEKHKISMPELVNF
jgi:hypothetical protein